MGLLEKELDEFGDAEWTCVEKLRNMLDSYDKILLSSEGLWFCTSLPKLISNLMQLLNKNNNLQIKVIVYLRRQDEHLESLWNFYVKLESSTITDTCFEYAKKNMNLPRYDYFAFLENLSDVVGKSNVICKIYNSQAQKGTALMSDFLSIFGILDDIDTFKIQTFQANPPLNKNMVEIKRILNTIPGSDLLNRGYHKILFDKAFYAKNDEDVKHVPAVLTYDQRKFILDYCEASNIRLGKEYFGVEASPFPTLERMDEELDTEQHMYEDVVKFMGHILTGFAEQLYYSASDFELSKSIPDGSRVIVYGGQRKGRAVCYWVKRMREYHAICIADKLADQLPAFYLPICFPHEIEKYDFDYIIISVDRKKTEDAIQNELEERGIPESKIVRAAVINYA